MNNAGIELNWSRYRGQVEVESLDYQPADQHMKELAEEVWHDKAPAKYSLSDLLIAARQKLTEQNTASKTKGFSGSRVPRKNSLLRWL